MPRVAPHPPAAAPIVDLTRLDGFGAPPPQLAAPPGTPDDVDFAAWCHLAFEATPIGIAFLSLDRRALAVNPALCRILGRTAEEVLGCAVQDLTHPEDLGLHVEPHRRLMAGEIDRYCIEKRYQRSDGSSVWTALHVVLVRDAAGEPHMLLSQCEDISAVKAAEEELRRQAHQDPLTGLLNRRRFLELLTANLDDGWGGALLFIDVDDFKAINDRHGHAAGDDVLVALGQRLAGVLRPTDLVSRFGGDELVAFVAGGSAEAAVEVARRIADTLHGPLIGAQGAELPPTTVSIGIAVATGTSVDQLLRRADQALYTAKATGRARIELHR